MASKATGHPTSQSQLSRTSVLSSRHFPQRMDRIWDLLLHLVFNKEEINSQINCLSGKSLNALRHYEAIFYKMASHIILELSYVLQY